MTYLIELFETEDKTSFFVTAKDIHELNQVTDKLTQTDNLQLGNISTVGDILTTDEFLNELDEVDPDLNFGNKN
jgi:hypothetical protein